MDFQNGVVNLPDLHVTPELARRLKRIVTVACGTSAYSGLVGKFIIEDDAHRSRSITAAVPLPRPDHRRGLRRAGDPQSGETVDTLAAMEEAREKGAKL